MGSTPQPAAAPKRILLVDDDAVVVKALHKAMTRRGYEVLAAETLEEAVAAAKKVDHIDLLVVDAVMPKVSGPDLAEVLLFLRPDMKVLFITGLDGLAIRLAFDRPCVCLQKPFTTTTLLSKVQELVGLAETAHAE
jgi:two-component system, cell cycle sensor histidine kinase and response regulator CckA